jgi:hypothetical protein
MRDVDLSRFEKISLTDLNYTNLGPYGTSWLDIKLNLIHHLRTINWAGGKVLDIGIGRGEAALFLRKTFDVEMYGLEICEAYISRQNASLYDRIYLGSVAEVDELDLAQYDLVLWLDSIEHLEICDAERLSHYITSRSKLSVISTPNRVYRQGRTRRNEHEAHKCFLDLLSMRTLQPYLCHFTMYGSGMYFFASGPERNPKFMNSVVTTRTLKSFLTQFNIRKSGFYTCHAEKAAFEFTSGSVCEDTAPLSRKVREELMRTRNLLGRSEVTGVAPARGARAVRSA